MPTAHRPKQHRPERECGVAAVTFNTAIVAVGGLYLATHSVTVTLIGTAASTALTCWAIRLPGSRHQARTMSRDQMRGTPE
jgi:hypothetical protein